MGREGLTSLGLVLRAERWAEAKKRLVPELPKPEVRTDLLVMEGINPNRQRVGKSGELPRRR